MTLRATFWPTVITVPALAVLVALGGWQLHRMQWKTALIGELQVRGAASPIPLPLDTRIPTEDLLYRPVRVTGRFIHDAESYLLNRVRDGTPGIHVVTPFVRADGGPTLLVNRGWVPLDWPQNRGGAAASEDREVVVTGVIRAPEPPGWFTPENNPERNEWYYLDLSAMAESVGVLPFVDYYIYATGEAFVDNKPEEAGTAAGAGGTAQPTAAETHAASAFPVPNTWRVDLPNNHLSYALTWFALAAALLVIYFVYHARQAPRTTVDDSG
ncbi:MAG: SURF1 family protein [Rhodospirillales bacterium]|nr:MAG: SURF1 family protein [Rhodospirillales bacterium]